MLSVAKGGPSQHAREPRSVSRPTRRAPPPTDQLSQGSGHERRRARGHHSYSPNRQGSFSARINANAVGGGDLSKLDSGKTRDGGETYQAEAGVIRQRGLQLGCNSRFVATGANSNYLKYLDGWVAEWLKAPVLKCARALTLSASALPPTLLGFQRIPPRDGRNAAPARWAIWWAALSCRMDGAAQNSHSLQSPPAFYPARWGISWASASVGALSYFHQRHVPRPVCACWKRSIRSSVIGDASRITRRLTGSGSLARTRSSTIAICLSLAAASR